jgi:hypothetical protein
MNTPPGNPSGPPEALALALNQLHGALKTAGPDRFEKLLQTNEGVAEFVWMLEKLCKCALDWQEYAERLRGNQPGTAGGNGGLSNESLREAEQRFEQILK